jgi:hypothetical protein
MLKRLLVIFILCDLAVLTARNLALRSYHLDSLQLGHLTRFNRHAGLLLLLAFILLFTLIIFSAKKSKLDTWPKTPPQ